MEKLRGFNLVYLATAQRKASCDSDVPGMKNVEAFRPECRCCHSTHWLTPGGSRISAFFPPIQVIANSNGRRSCCSDARVKNETIPLSRRR